MLKLKLSTLKISRFRNLNLRLLDLVSESVWLGGGAIRSIVNQEHPNDYDFFFKKIESAVETEEKLLDLGFFLVFKCPVGSLSTYKLDGIKVQLITSRFYDSIEACIGTFDFTITCAGIDNTFLYLHDRYLKDLKNKYLCINILTFPAATINRLFKYKKYGYYTADVILEIVDLTYKQDLNIIDATFLYMD